MAANTKTTTTTATTTTVTDTERSTDLRQSPMMAHLLDALKQGTDIGHYGRLVFVMVARHFMDEDAMVKLLAKQPDHGADDARALVRQVAAKDYNPPKRERILEWQVQQDFPIIPDADDPQSGNVYGELQFPDRIYAHINDYYAHHETETGEARS